MTIATFGNFSVDMSMSDYIYIEISTGFLMKSLFMYEISIELSLLMSFLF